MSKDELEMLKIVVYDYANGEKNNGRKKSRWECLQFAAGAIEGSMIPKEIIEYISQLNFQTNLIKS